jgi:hypothetical protein
VSRGLLQGFSGFVRERGSTMIHILTNRNVDRSTTPPVAIGARFRMSVLGAAHNPRLVKKEGTIVGTSRHNSSVRVLFDGRKTLMSLHRDYVMQIPPEAE